MTKKILPGAFAVSASDVVFDEDGQVRGIKPTAKVRRITLPASKPLKRYKRDPLEGHPRAAETRELMRKAHIDDEVEVMDLQASEIACAVADKWAKARIFDLCIPEELRSALERLELVTRPSAMRKVRP